MNVSRVEGSSRKRIGMNGFGRFGIHFLKYWLDRAKESNFSLYSINDDSLTREEALNLILGEKGVPFSDYKVCLSGETLEFTSKNNPQAVYRVLYSQSVAAQIPWLGKPDFVVECSGKLACYADCALFLTGVTRSVMIAASADDAEKTLIYGVNHQEYTPNLRFFSYGSCTVNAFIPVASFIHENYEVVDSDVNVIHNIQHYRADEFYTLLRRHCSLERFGPKLLPFLKKENFAVNYTVVPYTGVSMIDFRFRVKRVPERDALRKILLDATNSEGRLKGLYGCVEVDKGPEEHKGTVYSAVLVLERARIVGDSIYLFGYFDNENSANRFYDVLDYVSGWDPTSAALGDQEARRQSSS